MTIRGSDSFIRPNQVGLGTASDGQVWTQPIGSTPASILNNQGVVTGNNGDNIFVLGSTTQLDQDVTVHITPSNAASASGVVLRMTDSTHYYRARVSAGVLTIVKVIGVSTSTLVSVSAFTETNGAPYWVHASVQGVGTNNLQASAWLDSDPNGDPGPFAFASDATITAPGQFGLRIKCNSNVDTVAVDSFLAQDPAPIPPPPNNVSADSPYGVTISTSRNHPQILTFQTITDLLAWGNGTWVRYQLRWSSIEQTQGVYTWALLDWAVNLCNTYGINLCFPIQDCPTFYKTIAAVDGSTVAAGTGQLPNATDLTTFAVAVATRYNGQNGFGIIPALQIGNEEWDISSPRDDQAKWLVPVVNAAYPAIKAVHPTCRVGINAIRGTTNNSAAHVTNWLTNLYTYNGGIGAHADWLDTHIYKGGSANPDPNFSDNNSQSVGQRIAMMHNIPVSFGHQPEVWCCEFGYDLYDDATGPQTTLTSALVAGVPVLSLSVAALTKVVPNATQITVDYAGGSLQENTLYAYGKANIGDVSIAVTTNSAGSGAAQAAWTPAQNHASGAKVYGFTSTPVFTPAQVEGWMWEFFEDFRTLGGPGAHALIYTMTPAAKVNTALVPQSSTNTKSITQIINGVETHLLPYSDPATGQGIKEEAARYPTWPGSASTKSATLTSSAGNATVSSAQGVATITSE